MTTAAPLNAAHPTTLPSYEHPETTTTTTTDDRVPRGPVTVPLHFYKPPEDGSAPYNWVEKQPNGAPQRNFTDTQVPISLSDARGQESQFTLDKHAFVALQNHPHNPSITWTDDESIKSTYYPEVERILLQNLPGNPSRVLIFDHTVRRANPNAHRGPVTRCHIDQTAKSAKQRVEFHLPDEAPELLKGRYRIVNVWRPINGTVESSPLAFADSQSVKGEDMVGVEHRYPDRTGETAAVSWSEGQKWWYWSGVGDDERILLQCFDSWNNDVRVPHTAFTDPRNNEGAKPRESIEVRALIFG